MARVVTVRLREFGTVSNFLCGNIDVKVGDYVLLEAERGIDYGQAISEPEEILENSKSSFKKIIKIMDVEDLRQVKENKSRAKRALKICEKKVKEFKLPMKLIDSEYSFDRSKVIFYFTAEGRIDFRELVKHLAKIFKTRIEMRQIGVRDEARFFGGMGPCGRVLCCASFLKSFEPVSVKMAKEQRLPLNPTKISGICGRLMCCLSYEFKLYMERLKDLPKEGKTIDTPWGKAKVIEVNPLKREVVVELKEGKKEKIKYE